MTRSSAHDTDHPAGTRRKKNGKGPGRPEGTSVARDEILDAAEIMFAEHGYMGTTLRQIADATSVTQALINYYFGSKQDLFREVFLRRGDDISQQRLDNLRNLLAEEKTLSSVRDIVQAFLLPTLSLRNTAQGRAFLRLQSRLHMEPPAISYQLRANAYDESTLRYIDALRRALPQLAEADLFWRMTLMIGTYLYAFSDTHRLEKLAPAGMYNPEDSHALIEQVTRFVTGGFCAD